MENEIQTTVKKSVQTPFMKIQETEYLFRGERGIKMTRRQKGIIKRFVDNHLRNENFIPLWVYVHTGKYFSGVTIRYFPKNAHNTVYTEKSKTLWIGVRGGIRKMTVRSSLSDDRDVTKIWNYYMKAED